MEHIEQEVIRLHDFFVEWMTGTVEKTNDEFSRFADSMSDRFYIVAPSGHLTHRKALVEGLYKSYNQHQNFRIWIENVQVKHTLDKVVVATYEEWQEFKDKGKTTSRLSTVMFRIDETKTNKLLWLCVHETWLPQL